MMSSPEPPYKDRKYARIESELRYFIDNAFRDPKRNFGLDTIMEMDALHLVRFPPENLRQFPTIIFMFKSMDPYPNAWGHIEKYDHNGVGYTGAQYNINFEIHAIIERHAAIVYNGVKYQHVEGNYSVLPSKPGTLDVLKSVIQWILLANQEDCNPERDWGWRSLKLLSVDYHQNYNGDRNLFGVRFRCTIDWEWDVPFSEIGYI